MVRQMAEKGGAQICAPPQKPLIDYIPGDNAVKGLADLPSHLRYGLQESHGASLLGYGGTFAHPDIAIAFAQWCSPAFRLWVSRQIRHLMTYGEVNLHYREWSKEEIERGIEFSRDDIREMYR